MKKSLVKKVFSPISTGKQTDGIDGLARMVKGGFDRMDEQFKLVGERFDGVDKRFDEVDKRFDQVDGEILDLKTRVSGVEREISAIRHHLVYREEFEDMASRMKLVELKLGIRSGK